MAKRKTSINIENVERFCPEYKSGLTVEQIELRNSQGLINISNNKKGKSIVAIIYKNLFTFFNLMYALIFILLISSGIYQISRYIFVLIVSLNTAISIFNEIKAKLIIDSLVLQAASKVIVIRSGQKKELNQHEVVLDDIICLVAGNQIITDAIVVKGEVEVNESQLTGESIPIRKLPGDTLYSGSFVVSGNCHCQVERVGNENTIEKLSSMAKTYSKPKSEIMRSLGYLLRVVGIIYIPFGFALFIKSENISSISDFFASFSSATFTKSIDDMSGALLGMIPAGLILLTTIALAVGVRRLSKNGTLVHEIFCIEMLARVDVLCLDKTGTITDGTMTVTRFIEPKRSPDFTVTEIVSSMNEALQEPNSTSKALEAYFGSSSKFVATEVYPFTSENKYSAVTFEKIGTFILGAPEFVLKSGFERIADEVNEYANQGLRVLVLAQSNLPFKDGKMQRVPKIVALILIEDQIRKEASDTIKYFKENGVAVKVISGDNPVTVAEVARRVGIQNAESYISLDGMTDEEVMQIANNYTVFGRVKPEQKKILVQSMKKAKHTVAMTGDGVNDILALKEADCSIAMNSGCEAVKNVAQLVLLDSNFASMPQVVNEGRRVINNIQQTSSLFLVKTLFTIMTALLVIVGFVGKYTPDSSGSYPINSSQILMIEMFAIGFPAFFLALQPNKSIIKGRFLYNVIRKSLPGAITIAIQVMFAFAVAKPFGFSIEVVRSVIVLSATATTLMILYLACQPFNIVKAMMVIVLFACCFVISFGSIGAKVITLITLQQLILLILLGIFVCIFLFSSVRESRQKTIRFSIICIVIFLLGLILTDGSAFDKVLFLNKTFDFRAEFQIVELWTRENKILNATPLLLFMSLALSSYIVIFVVDYVINFLLKESTIEKITSWRARRKKI